MQNRISSCSRWLATRAIPVIAAAAIAGTLSLLAQQAMASAPTASAGASSVGYRPALRLELPLAGSRTAVAEIRSSVSGASGNVVRGERGLPAGAAELILELAEAEAGRLEAAFGHPVKRPEIYLFATSASFARGLEGLGVGRDQARQIADAHPAVFDPSRQVIALNWSATSSPAHLRSTLRHELTHALVRDLVGPATALPAWFEEGIAMRDDPLLAEPLAGCRALAAWGARRLPLTGADWSEAIALHGTDAYRVAARAAGRIVAEAGDLPALLRSARDAGSLAGAYRALTGRDLPDSLSSSADRPVLSGSAGALTVWCVAARPGAAGSVRIAGAGYELEYRATAGPDGVIAGSFGGAAAGTFGIEITLGDRTVTGELRVAGQ